MRNWFRQAAVAPAADGDWFRPAAEALAELISAKAPRSIFCIANSDEVPVDAVLARVDPRRDLLCQYNGCRHGAAFAGRGLASLFCFHTTDRPGVLHGIGADGRPEVELAGYGPGSRICVLRIAPDSVFGARGVAGALPDLGFPAFEIETGRLRALFYRPEPQVIASAGFASVLLFHLINLRRALAARPPHRVVLCGFSGRYAGGGFMGHDFRFEQQELAKLPNLSRLDAGNGAASTAAASRLHHDLKDIFHEGFNEQRATKADLLFDVARLHFAAGDMAAFVAYLRRSAGLNPGRKQMHWLLRALELVRERGSEAELAGLERLVADLDALQARWSSGTAANAGADAPEPAGLVHPQAAYAVGTGDRPRVLIVNETSRMPYNRWHLGCELVSHHLRDRLEAHGLDCVGWANGIAGINRIVGHDPAARFEAVLINGEGTLHDDADRAFEIGVIGAQLRAMGKRVFLINSVWEANGPAMEALVRDFDLVAVRESFSQSRLARVRPDARVVPDLCWLEDATAVAPPHDPPCGILDCVEPETSARLERLAAAAELPVFVMHRFFEAFHRAVAAGRPVAAVPRVLRRGDLATCPRWIGGRFHGMVLALGAGVPMLATPSNTSKIEAMLADIGLEDKLLQPEVLDGLAGRSDVIELFSGRRAFTASDWAKVAAYKELARREIDRMFADIAAALA